AYSTLLIRIRAQAGLYLARQVRLDEHACAELQRRRPGEQELDRAVCVGDPAAAEDRQLGQRAVAAPDVVQHRGSDRSAAEPRAGAPEVAFACRDVDADPVQRIA